MNDPRGGLFGQVAGDQDNRIKQEVSPIEVGLPLIVRCVQDFSAKDRFSHVIDKARIKSVEFFQRHSLQALRESQDIEERDKSLRERKKSLHSV